MSDVRNVDLQFEIAVCRATHEDGIVKVARGFAINCDDRKIAEIAPRTNFGARNIRLGFLCFP